MVSRELDRIGDGGGLFKFTNSNLLRETEVNHQQSPTERQDMYNTPGR
jgi:hypothetical protein